MRGTSSRTSSGSVSALGLRLDHHLIPEVAGNGLGFNSRAGCHGRYFIHGVSSVLYPLYRCYVEYRIISNIGASLI